MKALAKRVALLTAALAIAGTSFGGTQEKEEAARAAAVTVTSAAAQSTPTAGSVAEVPAANPKDVESLDAIVTAVYDVISGPPGPRDWNRFNSLFAPDARLIAVRTPKDGGKPSLVVMTPKGYEERAGKHFPRWIKRVRVRKASGFVTRRSGSEQHCTERQRCEAP